jgi:hypothetical protein
VDDEERPEIDQGISDLYIGKVAFREPNTCSCLEWNLSLPIIYATMSVVRVTNEYIAVATIIAMADLKSLLAMKLGEQVAHQKTHGTPSDQVSRL